MVPMVVGSDQLVSHLLLLRRQAGIERLERSKETGVVVDAHLRELLAQLEALDRVHVTALLPRRSNRLVERLSVLAHCRLDLLPLRLLRRRDLELGLQESDAPVDELSGHPPFHRVMARLAWRCRRIRRRRRGLRQGGSQSDRSNAEEECRGEEWRTQPDHFGPLLERGSCPSFITYGSADRRIPGKSRITPI